MLKNILKWGSALLMLLVFSCKPPTDDLKVVVDTNLLKYTSLIHVTDAAMPDSIPQNVSLTISGQNADNIYEISGKKVFNLVDGIITLGVGPEVTPTDDSPIKCDITVNAPGYTSVTYSISYSPSNPQQVINIALSPTNAGVVTVAQPDTTTTGTLISLDFAGSCVNKPNFELRPSTYIFYRETGSTKPYQYLGYVTKGYIETRKLTLGNTYDFQITYGGKNYSVSQQVTQTSYIEHIDMGDVCNNF
jgi:hypothetical protein